MGPLTQGVELAIEQVSFEVAGVHGIGSSAGVALHRLQPTGVVLAKLKLILEMQASESGGNKPSLSVPMATAATMRDQCKGTLHLVTIALADDTIHIDGAMVVIAGKGVDVRLMSLGKNLRPALAGFPWSADMAHGVGGLAEVRNGLAHPWRRL